MPYTPQQLDYLRSTGRKAYEDLAAKADSPEERACYELCARIVPEFSMWICEHSADLSPDMVVTVSCNAISAMVVNLIGNVGEDGAFQDCLRDVIIGVGAAAHHQWQSRESVAHVKELDS